MTILKVVLHRGRGRLLNPQSLLPVCFSLLLLLITVSDPTPLTAQTPDLTPLDLRVTARMEQRWDIRWDHPVNGGEAQLTNYNVYRIDENANDAEYLVGTVPIPSGGWGPEGTELKLFLDRRESENAPTENGFWVGETYRFEVEGVLGDGTKTPRSAPAYFGTAPAPVVIAMHTDDKSYVDVRWTPSTRNSRGTPPITTWEVMLYDNDRNQYYPKHFHSRNNLRRVLMNLPSGGTWQLAVRGRNAAGWGASGYATFDADFTPFVQAHSGTAEHRDEERGVTYKLTGPTRLSGGMVGTYTLQILRNDNHQPAPDVYLNVPLGARGDPNRRLGLRGETSAGSRQYENRFGGRTGCDWGGSREDVACLEIPYDAKGDIREDRTYISAFSNQFKANFWYTRARRIGPIRGSVDDGWRHGDTINLRVNPTVSSRYVYVWTQDRNILSNHVYVGFKPFTRKHDGAERVNLAWLDNHCEALSDESYDRCRDKDVALTGWASGNTRRIKVRLVNAESEPPAPPRNLSLQYQRTGNIVVEWDNSSNHERVRMSHYILHWEPLDTSQDDGHELLETTSTNRLVVERQYQSNGTTIRPLRIRVRGWGHASASSASRSSGEWSEGIIAWGPSPPTSLQAVAGPNSVQLRWAPPSNPVGVEPRSFEVLWAEKHTEFHQYGGMAADRNHAPNEVQIKSVAGTGTSAVIPNLQADTTYYFSVRAKGPGEFRSATSPTISARTATAATVLARAVANLTATGEHRSVRLQWDAPDPLVEIGVGSILGYEIRRSADNANWITLVTNTQNNDSTYADRDLGPNTQWFYQLRAINSRGAGEWSVTVSATTLSEAPWAPQQVTVSIAATDRIDVRWQAPDEDGGAAISAYQVQRRTTGTTEFTTVLSLDASHLDNHFTDSTVTDATTTSYEYVVQAQNDLGLGTSSAAVPTEPGHLPAAPTVHASTVATMDGSPRMLRVAWLPSPYLTDVTQPSWWRIYYRADSNEAWILWGERNGYAAREVFVPVSMSGTYHVSVRGGNVAGLGAPGESTVTVTFEARDPVPVSTASVLGVTLGGPTLVIPGQLAEYTLSGAYANAIGVVGRSHRVSTVAESGVVMGLYNLNDCDFSATSTPPVHICLRLPRNSNPTTRSRTDGSITVASYTGFQDGHTFEVWVNPDFASMGQTFEIGFRPTVTDDGVLWHGVAAETALADSYRLSVTIDVLRNQRPEPPSNLQTTLIDGAYNLSWDPPANARVTGVNTYDIELQHPPGTNHPLLRNLKLTNYTIPDPQPTAPVVWRVRGKRDTNLGVYSEWHILGGLGPPLNLAAEPGDNIARLTWDAPNVPALTTVKQYVITRATTPSLDFAATELARVDANTLAYHDNTADNDTEYFYAVLTLNPYDRFGPASNSVSVTPTASVPTAPPAPPTAFTVESIHQQFVLRWQVPADVGRSRMQGYAIQRAVGFAPEADDWEDLVANTNTIDPHYTHSPAPALRIGTIWSFRVATINSIDSGTNPDNPANRSEWTEAVFATIVPTVTVPVDDLVAWPRSDSWVRLRWSPPEDRSILDVYFYRVERWDAEAVPPGWIELEPLQEDSGEDQFSFDDKDVTNARNRSISYTYRVFALRVNGVTDTESNRASTDPAAPLAPLPELDINGDGEITGDDALILYYTETIRNQPHSTALMIALRRQLLSRLMLTRSDPSDTELENWMDRAERWIDFDGVHLGGDLDESTEIDQADSRILYNTYTFPELLGDGRADSGFMGIRTRLIGTELGTKDNPAPDEESREVIPLARELFSR